MFTLSVSPFDELLTLYEQVRNEKARRYLSSMRKKRPIPFSQKFPNADPLALRLLERMLAFEPKDRPNAEEVSLSLFVNLAYSINSLTDTMCWLGVGSCWSLF